MTKFEVGRVNLSGTIDSGITRTVSFQFNYNNPIVIVYKADNNTGFSAGRARNVTSTSAEIFHEEPDNGGGSSNTFTYLVAESGSYEIDGYQIEAGTVSSSAQTQSGQSETVNFQQSFTSTPVLLHGLQSYNNNEFMSTSALSVGTSSFSFGLENLETGASSVTEEIGYFAIEEVSGGGTIGGNTFETQRTSNSVTDSTFTVNFSESYNSAPDVIAAGQVVDGGDGYVTVGTGVTSTSSHSFFADEDTRNDSETGHTSEIIGYIVIEQSAAVGDIAGPTNVSINSINENEVLLSWDSVSSTIDYNIYRSESSGTSKSDYTLIDTSPTTSYTDTNVEDGEEYYYRISSTISNPTSSANIIEDFESLNGWQGDTNFVTLDTDNIEGTNGFTVTGNNDRISKDSGFNQEFQYGNSARVFFRWNGGESTFDGFHMYWGMSQAEDYSNTWQIRVRPRRVDFNQPSGTNLVETNGPYIDEDVWYDCQIDWGVNGVHRFRMFDLNGNLENDFSITDDSGSTSNTGIGIRMGGGGSETYDTMRYI